MKSLIQLCLMMVLGPLLFMALSKAAALGSADVKKIIDEIARKAAASSGLLPIQGKDGWLFFSPDLRCLCTGRFWNESTGALPAILDFKAQLDRAGIELLYVPVPAKASIYPARVCDAISQTAGSIRIDIVQQEFHALLKDRGLTVIDLTPAFLENRNAIAGPLYCRQDSHWSGVGCEIAARTVADAIRLKPWLKGVPRKNYSTEEREIEITGDLWRSMPDPKPTKEKLKLRFIGERAGSGMVPVADWRESPVLLLGDSHNLVFHVGADMLATGAGFADQLAYELGFPVDVVAVRGSGATPSRLNLMRRGDSLAGKKLIIWCLSVREYIDESEWRKIPVVR